MIEFDSCDCPFICCLALLTRWQDSGRLRGYGHVVFDSEGSRNKAVDEINGKHLGARYLTVQAPKAPRPDTSMGAVEKTNACPTMRQKTTLE
jgi:nucleolin